MQIATCRGFCGTQVVNFPFNGGDVIEQNLRMLRMNRMGWISIAALELVLGAVLLVLGTVWRYPHSHFGVWVGLLYGGAFNWVSAPHATLFYVAAMQDTMLLVGALLVGSAVFVYWESARSEQGEKLGLLA